MRKRLLPALAALGLLLLLFVEALAALPDAASFQDFGAFVGAAQAQRLGLNPYGTYLALPDQPAIRSNSPNANPPLSLLLFAPLAFLDPVAARYGWHVVTIGLHIVTLVLLSRAYPERATPLRLLWAAALLPFWFSLHMGQIYTMVAFIALSGWLLLRQGRALAAGLLIGLLVALKPQLAVWPALLLLAGHWPVALAAAVLAGLLSLLPLVLFGPEIYARWLGAVGSDGASLAHQNNASLIGLASTLSLPPAGVVAAGLLLLGTAAWALRFRPAPVEASRVALVAALLASPLGWSGYSLLLMPLFFEKPWSFSLRLAALIFLVPLPVGPGYTAALLALLASLLRPYYRAIAGGPAQPCPPSTPR